jgi:predicted short-subunit dehydrogenase-like oxidoreductase (DUF2520 family)
MEVVKGTDAMSKQTGLAAFTGRKAALQAETVTDVIPAATASASRKRGKGQIVSLTLRLSRGDWERVHQLAVTEGTSIQQLAVQGLSKVFTEKGLPGISG